VPWQGHKRGRFSLKITSTEDGLVLELDKFKELEEKIKTILSEYALLKKQNQELNELLNITGLELEGAKGKLGEFSEERDIARARLDALIGLLQNVDVNM
jgi:hypothetical protein